MLQAPFELKPVAQPLMPILAAAIVVSVWMQRVPAFAEDAATVTPALPKIAAARVGLSNRYKLGTWTPVMVEVSGAGAERNLRVEVTASDNDGVATTASVALPHRTTEEPRRAIVHTQVGRVRSPIRIVLADGERQFDELVLQPSARSTTSAAIVPMPATGELILSLGSAQFGLRDAFPDRPGGGTQTARAVIEVNDVAELPAEWFGYDAIDVVVLAANDGQLIQSLGREEQRFAALQRWVELGGRLVLLCGANSKPLLEPGGPLSTFAPGKLADIIHLPDAIAVENFAASAPRIGGPPIPVLRLQDVAGKIEAFAGRRPTDLPLVIRTPRGFGEITFVALEFNEPPLANWPGRAAFLQVLLRPYLSAVTVTGTSQRLATSGITDLAGALRQQLGRSFESVVSIGFPAITGLTIAYLFVLGPLDYLIVHRWLRRPLAAWITFPLIVLGFTAAALAIGNWSRGPAGTRVNRLSLVDIDTISGQSRGTLWSSVYSPNAARFNLAVRPPSLPSDPRSKIRRSEPLTPDPSVLLSWWGLPGGGIGGMQASGTDLALIPHGYRRGPQLDSLEGLPILASGTKSLIAHWADPADAKIASDLSDADDLLAGTIANETALTLRNVRLFYGSWGYQLGNIGPGEQIDITDELSPRRAKTIVTRDVLGGPGATAVQVEGRLFSAEQASPMQVLNLMMFYETAGGNGFANVPNRCQSRIDFSRQLDLGRAVLVADVSGGGADLIDQNTGQPLGGAEDAPKTVYRFILPVKKPPPSP
jgi:hypothetical protein